MIALFFFTTTALCLSIPAILVLDEYVDFSHLDESVLEYICRL